MTEKVPGRIVTEVDLDTIAQKLAEAEARLNEAAVSINLARNVVRWALQHGLEIEDVCAMQYGVGR